MEEFQNTDGSQNLQSQNVRNQQYDQSAQGGQTDQGNQSRAQGSQGPIQGGQAGSQVAQGAQGAQQGGQMAQRSDKSREGALVPPVDVVEDAGGITLYADMPGVAKDKLSLQMEADSLTIEGEVALEMVQGMQSNYAEIKVPYYHRSFTLSRELDAEQATAEFKNGVLKLRIPKAAHAQPRKIQVQAS